MPSKASANPPICQRIADLRRRLYGDRGKSRFAEKLSLSPSTYNYYESSRVPPAEVLVRIAEATGADLRWLLTGEPASPPVPADHPAVRRMLALVADRPEAAGPLAAFVDLLAAALAWKDLPAPAAQPPAGAAAGPRAGMPTGLAAVPAAGADAAAGPPARPEAGALTGPAGPPDKRPSAGRPAEPARPPTPPEAAEARRGWIPTLGRSAAGVPHFWADRAEGKGLTLLSDLIARHAGAARQVAPASASDDAGPIDQAVQIVTLTAPGEDDLVEFVVAPDLKRRHGDAFAVRIDGDSMTPEIRHGDLVICSPSAPAADGHAAIVQLENQIGVTCKVFRRAGRQVHLVPVNEQYPPRAFPARDVVWALRVLARVSPG